MGFFDGARDAGVGGGGDGLNPGRYPRLRIETCKIVNGHHGMRYLVHFRVMEPGISTGAQEDGNTYEPTPVDTVGSWGTKINGEYAKSGKGECNALGVIVLETTDLVEVEAALEASVGPGSPRFAGKEVSATVYKKRTGNGRFMLKANFGPVSGAAPSKPILAPAHVRPDAAGTVVAPPPVAPAAPEPFNPPEGWFVDPHGRGYYNASGAIKSEAELRAGA